MFVEFWDVGSAASAPLGMTVGEISGYLATDWVPSLPPAAEKPGATMGDLGGSGGRGRSSVVPLHQSMMDERLARLSSLTSNLAAS